MKVLRKLKTVNKGNVHGWYSFCRKQKCDQRIYAVGQNCPLGRSDLLLYLARFVEDVRSKKVMRSPYMKCAVSYARRREGNAHQKSDA